MSNYSQMDTPALIDEAERLCAATTDWVEQYGQLAYSEIIPALVQRVRELERHLDESIKYAQEANTEIARAEDVCAKYAPNTEAETLAGWIEDVVRDLSADKERLLRASDQVVVCLREIVTGNRGWDKYEHSSEIMKALATIDAARKSNE